MNEFFIKDYVKNLKKDIKILIKEKYHPRTHDLLTMVITEDLPEIIKFINKVIKVLETEAPKGDNDYTKGYFQALEDIKRDIYG